MSAASCSRAAGWTRPCPSAPPRWTNRSFIEWDKDDIDALGMMKVDVLALGMLTCIRKCFDAARHHRISLATVPQNDPVVYDMLCKGDSLGVFQVESRAQMNMLPRLKPRNSTIWSSRSRSCGPARSRATWCIPICAARGQQGGRCYPARAGGPPDELEAVLGKTLGVPLFQEQAMKLRHRGGQFTPEEANGLRRAMATFRNIGTITFPRQDGRGMVARGYERDFAERCFKQIEGFGTYGFPESHAASFAQLVYVSAWLKCHHPAAFAARC
jgi:error-prone DNA polymerase